MLIEIKNRWTGAVIFSHDCEDNTVKATLLEAIKSDANLSGADLCGAYLCGAYLRGADLCDADLSGADLTPIRDDIWAVLSSAPAEVPALIAALKEGRVDGSTYSGDCACLVGTIANIRHAEIQSLGDLKPNSSRPAERFFLGISSGDKPETNQVSELAVEWCEAWLNRMQAAFGTTV